jgi:hypothetical protein
MHLISLYFVVVALLLAGYGAALQAGSKPVTAALCVAGLVMTAAFWLFDIRTKLLIKAAEGPLSELQRRLVVASSVETLALVDEVEDADPKWSSYSNVVAVLMSASLVLMSGGLVYSLAAVGGKMDDERHGNHGNRDHSGGPPGSYAPETSGWMRTAD